MNFPLELQKYRREENPIKATILGGELVAYVQKLEANQKPEEPWFDKIKLPKEYEAALLIASIRKLYAKKSWWQRLKEWWIRYTFIKIGRAKVRYTKDTGYPSSPIYHCTVETEEEKKTK